MPSTPNDASAPIRVLCLRPELVWCLESFYAVTSTICDSLRDLPKLAPKADVVFFGDVGRDEFAPHHGLLDQLVDAVRGGTPLVYYGGWSSFGAGGYVGSSFEHILPVRMHENDICHVPHDTRGAIVAPTASPFSKRLNISRFPMSTTFSSFEARDDATVYLSFAPSTASAEAPLVVLGGEGAQHVLCISLCLVGGGAKDLLLWPEYPVFIACCLELLLRQTVVSLGTPARPRGFRLFWERFHHADGNTAKEGVIAEHLCKTWDRHWHPHQIQFLGDAARKLRSQLSGDARRRLLHYLDPKTRAYRKAEVEMFKYYGAVSADSLELPTAAAWYALAAEKQAELEREYTTRIWSYHYRGLSKLSAALATLGEPLRDARMVQDLLRDALSSFSWYNLSEKRRNQVPYNKRLAEALAASLLLLLKGARRNFPIMARLRSAVRRSWERLRGSGAVHSATVEETHRVRLDEFAEAFDEWPVFRDRELAGFISQAVDAALLGGRQRVASLDARAAQLRAQYPTAGYWKGRHIKTVVGIVRAAQVRRSLGTRASQVSSLVSLLALLVFLVFTGATIEAPEPIIRGLQLSALGLSILSGILGGVLWYSRRAKGLRLDESNSC